MGCVYVSEEKSLSKIVFVYVFVWVTVWNVWVGGSEYIMEIVNTWLR